MQDRINILSELKEAGAVALINTDNRNYYSVPDEYFNNLADNILTHIFIKSLPSANPYTIPEAYFENLSGIILEKITIRNIAAPEVDEKHIYSVPDGYFNSLADNILKKIRNSAGTDFIQQELEEISPLLSKIPRTNVYSIPENYFEELDPLKVAENDLKPSAKIISIGRTTRKWMNYAVAACLAAIVFSGGYLYFTGNKPIVDRGITMDVQKELSVLSDDEIANYLKDNNNIAVYTNNDAGDNQQQSMDMQTMLQNISDEEIQQYLSEDPESTGAGEGI